MDGEARARAGGTSAQAAGQGHTCPTPAPGAVVNGVRFDWVGRETLERQVESFVSCGQSHVVHFLASDPTVRAMSDPQYRELLNAADLNVADGLPVAWALRLNGCRSGRIAGTEGLDLLCRWSRDRGVRHYFYGGSEATIERLGAALRRRYPGLVIAGAHSPPFGELDAAELDAATARASEAGTDLLWIGLGTPKQHRVARALSERDAAPVILCVGAAFDFASGTKRRAPRWMQRTGLEWIHRLASEPSRLWRRYLIGNPRFVAGVLGEYLARRRGRRW